MSQGHFAFRHHGDLFGPCEACSKSIWEHTHYVLDDDGPDDARCTVAPVSMLHIVQRCSCGQHPQTTMGASGHVPRSDPQGTCYACGQPWPCEATRRRHRHEEHLA